MWDVHRKTTELGGHLRTGVEDTSILLATRPWKWSAHRVNGEYSEECGQKSATRQRPVPHSDYLNKLSNAMTRHNTPRWRTRKAPHIESFFVKANDLNSRQAIWLKVTCLKSTANREDAWIDVWCCYFDADNNYFDGGRTRFAYETVPCGAGDLHFETKLFNIRFGENGGEFHGKLNGHHSDLEAHLSWSREPSPLGEAYGMFPYDWMLRTPLPKQKTITPIGLAQFSGYIVDHRGRKNLKNWYGCQGHNWGQAHTPDYVWLQALLCENDAIIGTCEAFSGSVKLGGKQWVHSRRFGSSSQMKPIYSIG